MATTFDISVPHITADYADGDRVEVYTDVENITNSKQSDTLALNVDGTEKFTRDITLEANEERTFKLAWTVSVSADTIKSVTVTTTNDSSESRDATLRLHNDIIRIRFKDGFNEEYIGNAENIGPGT